MLACVTGGTGFIGSYLVRALIAAGHRVRVLHRPSSKLAALQGVDYESALGDVTDADSLDKAFQGCDWVFHVAAVADYWRAKHDWMFEVNVEGTRKVLAAAQKNHVQRVIFTSSAAAIGLRSDGKPSDESVAFNLPPQQFPYGYSKVLAEKVIAEFVAQGLDVVTVNPSVVMGAGDLNMISGSFVLKLHEWQWLAPSTTGGIAVIDVRDVAASQLAAAIKGRSGERYILSAANYNYADWFGMIAEVLGIAPPLFTTPNFILPTIANSVNLLRKVGISTPIDADQVRLGGRNVYFDSSKAWGELYQPIIPMRQSVEETYAWYKEQGYLKATWLTEGLERISHLWT